MTQEEFIEEYREVFGCKNVGETCWCDVCISLEKAWNDIHNHIVDCIKLAKGK